MIKIKIGDKTMNLNDLQAHILQYGRETISRFYSPNGLAWLYSSLDKDRTRFHDIAELIKKQDLDKKEREWVANLEDLVAFLQQLKKGLSTQQSQDYEMKLVLNLTDKLERLVKGYTDDKDPTCPACPNRNENATWESWREKISFKGWLNKISRIPWKRSKRGAWYPLDLVRE